jgi:hypothetical protein
LQGKTCAALPAADAETLDVTDMQVFINIGIAISLLNLNVLPVVEVRDTDNITNASLEVELLVKQSLEDRLLAGDLPDLHLLGNNKRLCIQEIIRSEGIRITENALPQLPGYEFSLTTKDSAQEKANQVGKMIFDIIINRPHITGEWATIWLGVGATLPADSNMVLLCCCKAHGLFQFIDGRWTFVRWMERICS